MVVKSGRLNEDGQENERLNMEVKKKVIMVDKKWEECKVEGR